MSTLSRILPFLKAHKWKVVLAVAVGAPFLLILFFILRPAAPDYVTTVAQRGDLVQSVEAVGTVISDRDLELQFATSGIVSQVYVKEGDKVVAGQRLAALRSGNLAADIASASARLLSAQADLRAREEGGRPEEIAVSEAEVQNKRASLQAAKSTLASAEDALKKSQEKLEALRHEAEVSLSGTVTAAGSTASQQLTAAENALSVLRNIFGNNDITDAIIKYNTSDYDFINASIISSEQSIRSILGNTTVNDFEEAIDLLVRTRIAVANALGVVNRSFDLVTKLPATSYFDESARESYKNSITAERTTLQSALGSIDSELKSLRDASANFATRISAEEGALSAAEGTKNKATADIVTYESLLRIAEAQLQLKKAPARQTDIDAALANVRQMRASLQRAQADFSNTILVAPIAGIVTKVNVKQGEITPVGPVVTMLGMSPYRIDMYVSEIDIPKVQLSQTGSIELDAFPGTHFRLHVSEIDTTSTDREGVSKYRIRLDFDYSHTELKIGMTGDAAIVTGLQKDVISVPLRAVLDDADGHPIVRVLDDGKVVEKRVETGMEGAGGDIEVTGVGSGETVIVLIRQ